MSSTTKRSTRSAPPTTQKPKVSCDTKSTPELPSTKKKREAAKIATDLHYLRRRGELMELLKKRSNSTRPGSSLYFDQSRDDLKSRIAAEIRSKSLFSVDRQFHGSSRSFAVALQRDVSGAIESALQLLNEEQEKTEAEREERMMAVYRRFEAKKLREFRKKFQDASETKLKSMALREWEERYVSKINKAIASNMKL